MLIPLLLLLPAAPGDSEMKAAVEAIIEHDGDSEQRTRALRRLGDEAMLPLWEIAVESLDSGAGPGRAVDEVAWSALGAFEFRDLRSLIREALVGAPTRGVRLASLRLVQEAGTARDLSLAILAATPPSGPVDPHLSRALSDAAAALLQRDPATYRALREQVLGAHPDLHFALVRALGAVRTQRSLDLLAFLLGFDDNLDVVLLAQIGVVAAELPQPIDEGVRGGVRELLAHPSPRIVQAAARASGQLGDAEAAGRLVDLLESEESGISSSAHWALTRLSGLRFPPDARRWRAWYTAETKWFESQARGLYDQLSSPDRALVVGAINQLSLHRMRRHEIATEVAVTLHSTRPEIRRLGCCALRQLDSTAALDGLLTALEDGDEGVVREAWLSLRAITKKDLPPDPTLWARAVAGSS